MGRRPIPRKGATAPLTPLILGSGLHEQHVARVNRSMTLDGWVWEGIALPKEWWQYEIPI